MKATAKHADSPAVMPDCQPPGCPKIETPAAIPTLAVTTPTDRRAKLNAAAAAAGASQSAPAATPPGGSAPAAAAADPATLQLCIQSFVRCIAHSPLVQSSLLSLELSATHPPAAEDATLPGAGATASLEWTLAQLLALHVKAGCVQGELPHP